MTPRPTVGAWSTYTVLELSIADATRLATDLFARHEIVSGQRAGLHHVLVDRPASPRSS